MNRKILCGRITATMAVVALSACGSLPAKKVGVGGTASIGHNNVTSEKASEVVMYALGLLETGYRFGGKNPEAGLDCSGMVSLVYGQAVGQPLKGSAADIARQGRPIDLSELRPGDLVFFNTDKQAPSRIGHVGIYIGEQRFIHAPSSGGKVRTDSLTSGWFASRIEAARTYFD